MRIINIWHKKIFSACKEKYTRTFVCLLRNNNNIDIVIIALLVSCLACLLHFTVAAYDHIVVTDHRAKIAQVKEK